MMKYNLEDQQTPCYVVDEALLENNLRILDRVQKQAGVKILLALKGFAMFGVFPLIRQYLPGVTASSLNEARLGREEFGGEVHLCAPAYREEEFGQLLDCCGHVVFNSFSQKDKYLAAALKKGVRCGLRINPEHREVETAIYDPCGPCSRLGVALENFQDGDLEGITGLHFHNLCEKGADALARTLKVVEEKFGRYISSMEWINMGGGHHITRGDYDVELLCSTLKAFKEKYGVEIYLEPGEAVALNTGVLVASVLDVVHNQMPIAILDASAATHMPDVLEMPYRPEVEGAGAPGELAVTYRLAGPSCLAGDVIGDYSFAAELRPGDQLVFHDMAHYTMVKNNTFNGINLPSIAVRKKTGEIEVLRAFTYQDYKNRLS
ncbi:carboxynorspermidine decarboxylase [Desulfatibacillum aliphaticivorans]|nr:carboxynorspermidine decarboxylase [Desulfatibacillum aliphaticivorans]